MLNTKKILAAALAATMVFGSSISVFADDPVTSGNTEGAGTSEGHVVKEVLNVDLPVIPTGSTPFAYTMDPERLIQETAAAKYAEGTDFPDKANDTGVYFLTGKNKYENTSNKVQAVNKSSCAIKLTVKVKATQKTDKDIALATSSTVASGEDDPNLYLGLVVGTSKTTVTAEEQTVDKIVPGVLANFETAVVDGEYVYQEKAETTPWKAMDISMEGAVSNLAIADDTTAPTVNVTWSYEKAAADATASEDAVNATAPAGPTEASASATSVAVGGSVNITLPEGVTISEIQKKKTDGTFNTLPTDYYTLEDITNGKKLTIKANMLTTYTSATKIKVVLSEGDPISLDVTAN